MTTRTGLHPDTWLSMRRILEEHDPLREGAAMLYGANLLLVGYEGAEPMGFVAGFSQAGLAVCTFIRCRRPWFGDKRTVRQLFEAWATMVREYGHTSIVTSVPREPETYRRIVEVLLRAAGFTLAADEAGEREWIRAATVPV